MNDKKLPLTHDRLDLRPIKDDEAHKAVRAWVTPNDFAIVGCSCGDQRGGRDHIRHLLEICGGSNRAAVRIITGFADEELTELGGFTEDAD